MCENTPPCGRRVSTQFLVFPISTRVDITVYQHGKCFIFLKRNTDNIRTDLYILLKPQSELGYLGCYGKTDAQGQLYLANR